MSALEAQLEALRQDNTVLAELLRDSRETFTAQFQREAGEVDTLRSRALAPLLSGQPAEDDELNDIVQMLGAAPALREVPAEELRDIAAVATTGRIETPRGPRALGALVLELQERLHASEREKASLRREASELQAEARGLQEQVKVQRGLKSAAQQQAHPRNQSTRLERLEHAMRAGKAVIQATPARAPQAERRLTVAELDLEELPSLAPPPESPPASRGDSGEVGGGGTGRFPRVGGRAASCSITT